MNLLNAGRGDDSESVLNQGMRTERSRHQMQLI